MCYVSWTTAGTFLVESVIRVTLQLLMQIIGELRLYQVADLIMVSKFAIVGACLMVLQVLFALELCIRKRKPLYHWTIFMPKFFPILFEDDGWKINSKIKSRQYFGELYLFIWISRIPLKWRARRRLVHVASLCVVGVLLTDAIAIVVDGFKILLFFNNDDLFEHFFQ